MSSRFNFYDFISYIIPGAFATAILIYFIGGTLGNPEFIISFLDSFGETILFLVISYVVGHVIQGRGRQIEIKESAKWGGYYSIQFLREENNYYSSDFKSKLKICAKDYFGLEVDIVGENVEQIEKDKRYQEIFNLCYALIIQKGLSGQIDIFNSIYGMFRGAIALREVTIFVSAVSALRHATYIVINYLAYGEIINMDFEITNLVISIAVLFFIIGVGSLLRKRLEHFAQRFVDSVYRNFLVFVLSTSNKGSNSEI